MMSVAENLALVRERISAACQRAGRDESSVRLVAVTKTVEPERIAQAMAAGQTLFGENYVQEARRKADAVPFATWHLVGHLQTNKVAQAVRIFELIHSVDSARLAAEIGRRAQASGKVQPVLLEVNLAGEATKAGVAEAEVSALARQLISLPHLELRGLMCLPPFLGEPERARPYFARLRGLRETLRQETGLALPELSMGMSGDFEVAIEEGATLVRVGTAIFGRRPNAA